MHRDEVIAIIRAAIEASVTPAGIVRIPVLSQSGEQVAIDIVDALQSAGFKVVRADEA
ncbi:MAG TPA: hypothetical protein VF027_05715 [Sphingomicrobium sp.]